LEQPIQRAVAGRLEAVFGPLASLIRVNEQKCCAIDLLNAFLRSGVVVLYGYLSWRASGRSMPKRLGLGRPRFGRREAHSVIAAGADVVRQVRVSKQLSAQMPRVQPEQCPDIPRVLERKLYLSCPKKA